MPNNSTSDTLNVSETTEKAEQSPAVDSAHLTQEAETLSEPGTAIETIEAVAPDEKAEMVAGADEEPVLQSRFASELGGGNHSRLTALFDRLGHLVGYAEKKDLATTGPADTFAPVAPKTRLGRGGWTAIAVLIVLLPLLGVLLYWALDLTKQVQGYKFNLEQIEGGQISSEREGTFITVLTSPKLQTFELQTTDAAPIGNVRLYLGDYKEWALAYGGLVPLSSNNVYMAWVVRLPKDGSQPQESDYNFLTSFVNQAGGAHYLIVPDTNFPANFAYDNFSRLIVTEEAGAKGRLPKPLGPIRFALDLSKVKLF